MLNVSGYLTVEVQQDIDKYTSLRFKNKHAYTTPEALSLWEQSYIDEKLLHELCEKQYGQKLMQPIPTFVPPSVVDKFEGTGLVPVTFMPSLNTVTVVKLPELTPMVPLGVEEEVSVVDTTLYYYMERYTYHYGRHPDLLDIPAKNLVDMVVKEGIAIGAADITISTFEKRVKVYYNARKSKINSKRLFSVDVMNDIVKYFTSSNPMKTASVEPKYVDWDLTPHYRGRILINHKVEGYMITIRLLPRAVFDYALEQNNLSAKTIKFCREVMMDSGIKGLRIICGATMSGKNQTALAMLQELVVDDKWKVVSIEMPVEQRLPGVEQINCDTLEEYDANIKSLIHANPDLVYVTEIRDVTGRSTVQMTNTGKWVLSSIHSNSVADCIGRLVDVTGYTQDRVIQTLHSIMYQALVRDDEKDMVLPKNRFVHLTDELKYKMYGKSIGEVIKIIKDNEDGDDGIF